jgi:predicted dinucleotide-binding enzyme
MKIGIIGAGAIGLAFAQRAAQSGHEVFISNSRGADSLKDTAQRIGNNVKAVSKQEAAEADIILLSIPWQKLEDSVQDLPDMTGKIILDANNPIINPGFILPDLGGKTSSEIVASLLPNAHIVKAFNTLQPAVIGPNNKNSARTVIFYSGDNSKAKNSVKVLLETLNFSGVDLGSLVRGGAMQQFPGGPLAGLHLLNTSN